MVSFLVKTILVLVIVVMVFGAITFAMLLSSNFFTNQIPSPYAVNVPVTAQPKNAGDTTPKIIVENLTIPWDIAFLPDPSNPSGQANTLLVTERAGMLFHIDPAAGSKNSIAISGVEHAGEGGLLGIVLHPKFSATAVDGVPSEGGKNNWLYLYITYRKGQAIENKVERYVFKDNTLSEKKTIIAGIPGSQNHDGGRMEFGPDGLLYITTGDAGKEELAQNTNSLAGKILRVNESGAIPKDNPFGNAVYSYGHRNPQGLAFDEQGRLWATEHGRSGAESGLDELNLIIIGQNYGWPDSQGDTVLANTVAPKAHSGATVTWAPASASYYQGRVFFGGLRGEALYEAVLEGEQVKEIKEHFKGEFGRIRTVRLAPDGMLYLTTSNRDGRGDISEGDDKIIIINPKQLK